MTTEIRYDDLFEEKLRPPRGEKLIFNEKEAELFEDGVNLFFKEESGSSIYLVHARHGSSYFSYWISVGAQEWSSREVSSGKSLSATNATLENKLVELAKDFASKDEIIEFLNKAGKFVKNNYGTIFVFKHTLERSKKEKALLLIYRQIKGRYNVVIDKDSYNLCIYDENKGVYVEYDEKRFSQLLKNAMGKEFFEEEVKKLMGLFHDIKEEDQNHIAFENCLMNIETLETREFTPSIFTKFKVPYNWNPRADSSFFQDKIYEIFDNPYKFRIFLQIVGYLFVKGNPHNKLFLLIGDGANGKSLLMQLISAIFINSRAAVPLQDFKKDFGLQPLIGKRVNLLFDLPSETIQETGQIKALTGGDDITINRKFKEPLTTILGCKIVGSGNRLPMILDDSYALWRRIVIIKLVKTFEGDKRDTNLLNKLLDDNEGMEWLIYHSIQAYKEIQETGWREDTYHDIRKQFLKNSDPAFYAAEHLFHITNDPDDFISREEIKSVIDDFLNEHGLRRPAKNREYYDAVKRCGAKEGQTNLDDHKVHGFRYIMLKK